MIDLQTIPSDFPAVLKDRAFYFNMIIREIDFDFCLIKNFGSGSLWGNFLIRLFDSKPGSLKYIVRLCKSISKYDQFGKDFWKQLYDSYWSGRLIRVLYSEGCFTIEEILEMVVSTREYWQFLCYFIDVIPEIELRISNSYVHSMLSQYIQTYKADNWKIYREMIEYGFPKDSIFYLIRYDRYDDLPKYLSTPNFDINQKIEYSPFQIISRIQIDSLLAFAAAWGSINCFKIILLNGGSVTSNVAICAFFGGNIEIIRLIEPDYYGNGECLSKCISSGHYEIANWFLEQNSDFSSQIVTWYNEGCFLPVFSLYEEKKHINSVDSGLILFLMLF